MFLCRCVAATALCAAVMVGRVPSSQAEPSEASAQRAVRDLEAAASYVQEVRLEEAIAGLQTSVGVFVDEVKRSEIAAQAATNAVARTSPAGRARAVSTAGGGGSCGGATNGADRYIQRESGGNPGVANPSGAYGCYQIMPYVWRANCSDLGEEIGSSPSAQAACASRLPLSAWGG